MALFCGLLQRDERPNGSRRADCSSIGWPTSFANRWTTFMPSAPIPSSRRPIWRGALVGFGYVYSTFLAPSEVLGVEVGEQTAFKEPTWAPWRCRPADDGGSAVAGGEAFQFIAPAAQDSAACKREEWTGKSHA
jgi:hypothetical protein